MKVKERCVKALVVLTGLHTGEAGKMIGTKVLGHTILVMADTEKVYLLLDKSKAREKLHIPMEAFKWVCLLMINFRVKSF